MKNSNTIIVGAGRLGGTIARSLNKTANVIVIDRNASKIDRLGEYSGFVEKGEATDRALLEKCGVRNCYRFIAVTDDDNTNIFLADLCTHFYHVPQVYIRLKDSRKRVLVDEKVNCICPFDLSLEEFESAKEMEAE
ncbi:MAG: TrkA family potassium uptake protein [Erysipelotrichaceae bacterium]|nr:TrkA family potassium uptake protein [Erysipelotrichaceae bacterium]